MFLRALGLSCTQDHTPAVGGGLLQIFCPYILHAVLYKNAKSSNVHLPRHLVLYVLVLIGFHAREFALSHCRTLRVVTDMGRASWGQLPSTTMILPPTIRTRREQHLQHKALRCANLVPHCYSCSLLSWLAYSSVMLILVPKGSDSAFTISVCTGLFLLGKTPSTNGL